MNEEDRRLQTDEQDAEPERFPPAHHRPERYDTTPPALEKEEREERISRASTGSSRASLDRRPATMSIKGSILNPIVLGDSDSGDELDMHSTPSRISRASSHKVNESPPTIPFQSRNKAIFEVDSDIAVRYSKRLSGHVFAGPL